MTAGWKNAPAAPVTISRPTSDQTDAVPVSTSVAVMSWLTPHTSWHVTMTDSRGSRSATTPAAGVTTMKVIRPPINTNPSAAAPPPDSMMANARPSGATVVLMVEEILASAYRR
ncbi:hypothetical protein OHA25_08100 [Nonomuraea sp. NBC_00507]